MGDLVYLRLQPYRQHSLRSKRCTKLSPKFYGPFQILQKLGSVAYKLSLPDDCLLHLVFHVSCLKSKLGLHVNPISTLPPMDSEGAFQSEPVAIIQQRTKSLRHRQITKVLVQWQGQFEDQSTWESLY